VRVRFRFTKLGKVRFTSHRDVARIWERAMRRAQLPLAHTEGFSPRPKVHFGLALSTSHESLGEYIDVDLREPEAAALDLEALPGLLSPLLPEGIDVEAVAVVDRADDSLQQAVTSCTWRIEVPGVEPSELAAQVAGLLASAEVLVTRERKGKTTTDDIRPAIRSVEVVGATPPERVAQGAVLVAELATQPRAVRPAELLAALDPPREEGHVCRLHQWIESDGARREPLPVATRTPHAEARAS
jgi:radical SAM-linked protein